MFDSSERKVPAVHFGLELEQAEPVHPPDEGGLISEQTDEPAGE